jgi:DNA-binding IclR family transcriptional regulator
MREDGAFPIRSFVLSEGVRFPLGVASAGLAILAFLPPHDVDAYFERHPELPSGTAPHAEPRLRARLRETHARGFALNPGLIVAGSFGIGAAVFTSSGHPQWALSLTGVEFRFTPERIPELGRTSSRTRTSCPRASPPPPAEDHAAASASSSATTRASRSAPAALNTTV